MDLDIYKDSKKLAMDIHIMSISLPKFEFYATGSQIRRSSKSVASSIVQGFGRRRYKNDFVKYLICSIAECDETILHLDFLYGTKSLTDEYLYNDLRTRYDQLSKKINKFTIWVEAKYIFTST